MFNGVIDQYIPPQSLEEQWDIKGLEERLSQEFGMELPISNWLEEDNNLHEESLRERIVEIAEKEYKEKEALVGEDAMHHFEKGVMLQTLDELWKEHLASMDYLRQGIHLRGYAQKDPKQEYKRIFPYVYGNVGFFKTPGYHDFNPCTCAYSRRNGRS